MRGNATLTIVTSSCVTKKARLVTNTTKVKRGCDAGPLRPLLVRADMRHLLGKNESFARSSTIARRPETLPDALIGGGRSTLRHAPVCRKHSAGLGVSIAAGMHAPALNGGAGRM